VPRYSANEQSLGPSRLLAFRLGGTAQLPAATPLVAFPKPPLPPPAADLAGKGEVLFSAYACDYCHGPKAERLGMSVPDLRKASKDTHVQFAGIVIGGVRAFKGMPAFHDMPIGDVEAIRAFTLSEAWAAYDAQQTGRANQESIKGKP